jgi:hypothetical protein
MLAVNKMRVQHVKVVYGNLTQNCTSENYAEKCYTSICLA